MLDPVVEDATEPFSALGHFVHVYLKEDVDFRVLVDEQLHFGARYFTGLAPGLQFETTLFFLALEVLYLSRGVQLEPPFLLHEKFVFLQQIAFQEGRSLALGQGESGFNRVRAHLGNLLLSHRV